MEEYIWKIYKQTCSINILACYRISVMCARSSMFVFSLSVPSLSVGAVPSQQIEGLLSHTPWTGRPSSRSTTQWLLRPSFFYTYSQTFLGLKRPMWTTILNPWSAERLWCNPWAHSSVNVRPLKGFVPPFAWKCLLCPTKSKCCHLFIKRRVILYIEILFDLAGKQYVVW